MLTDKPTITKKTDLVRRLRTTLL